MVAGGDGTVTGGASCSSVGASVVLVAVGLVGVVAAGGSTIGALNDLMGAPVVGKVTGTGTAGAAVGFGVGFGVGFRVGRRVVGGAVGRAVGCRVGRAVGRRVVGRRVGPGVARGDVGRAVGRAVGRPVGRRVGLGAGAGAGAGAGPSSSSPYVLKYLQTQAVHFSRRRPPRSEKADDATSRRLPGGGAASAGAGAGAAKGRAAWHDRGAVAASASAAPAATRCDADLVIAICRVGSGVLFLVARWLWIATTMTVALRQWQRQSIVAVISRVICNGHGEEWRALESWLL